MDAMLLNIFHGLVYANLDMKPRTKLLSHALYTMMYSHYMPYLEKHGWLQALFNVFWSAGF